MDSLEQAKRAKWWIAAALGLLFAGSVAEATLGSLARASDLRAVDKRLSSVEAHHEDDDRLLDWLVRATWMQHPELPIPPLRQAQTR